MTILIVGGTGKTGLKLAQLLHAANYSVLITSRAGVAPEPFKAVKFDWFDQKTFENPFKADSNIDKVYLIAPVAVDPLPIAKPFIDLAISKGVKRFVLISASGLDKGGLVYGKIHEYLVDIGVDYAVLRPTWFIENFGTFFYASIREQNEVFSVANNGRIPFVGADDIAKAAYDALVADKSPNTDYYIVGPELYTYDEAAALLSEILGRKITHRRLTNAEERAIFEAFGMTPDYAAALNSLEAKIAEGSEEALVKDKKTITGQRKLRDFLEANKALWIKA